MVVEDRLSEILSEFARTLVTDFPIQSILDHLVQHVVDVLPVDGAGVALISPTTHPEFVAGSNAAAVRYERFQADLAEGPCLAAYETDRPISIPDLRLDARFPRFAAAALDAGLVAVFTFPLRNGDRCLGALDLYRDSVGELGERDLAVAQTLADVATAYLLNAEARVTKTEFVAAVSHELRSPIGSIAGFVELLEDDDDGQLSADQRAYLRAIRRSSDRLMLLADDLLTLSRLESPVVSHAVVRVDLRALAHLVLEQLEPAISAKSLVATSDLPAEPLWVRGDPQRLESLLSNLLSNAVKFTPSGGWVRLVVGATHDHARIEVSDGGLGIPASEQAHLFTRFFRSSTAREHAIPGSGLGLNIVDSIVKSHGGEIGVKSEHLGGSTFTVTLPLTPVPVQEPVQEPEPVP